MLKLNLVGQVFGRLIVLEGRPKRGIQAVWLCRCECGKTTEVLGSNLRRGQTQSCGCLALEKAALGRANYKVQSEHRAYQTMAGKKFGRLTPITRLTSIVSGRKRASWECTCDCGSTATVQEDSIKKGATRSCGCYHRDMASIGNLHDLVGTRFGRLLVLSKDESSSPVSWLCQCDCGVKKHVKGGSLTTAATKSCGCLQKEATSLPIGRSRRRSLLKRYKDAAFLRGFEWGLSDEYFEELIASNCHYCGVPPATLFKRKRLLGELMYNGVDRKDNSKGYIEGNVVPACKVCNMAKHTMPYEEFLSHLHRAGKFQLQKSTVG